MAYINGTRIMSAQLNGLVAIDEELSAVSTNPVQNKAVGNTLANAVKGTVTGIGTVRMDDVSPVEHELDVKVTSKNLIPYPYAETTKTENGITFTDNGDGSVTVNGTATANSVLAVASISQYFTLTPGKYTVSGGFSSNAYIQVKNADMDKDLAYAGDAPVVFTLTETTKIRGNLYVKSGTTLDNVIFKPQIEIGTTATPYTPYISSMADLDGALVTRRGKNLFNKNDITCLLNGYISGAGVYMASSGGEKSFIFECQPNTDYVVSKLLGNTNRVAGFATIPSSGTAGKFLGEFNEKTSYTFNSGTAKYIIVWYLNNYGETVTNAEMLDSIQLETGTTATTYTPYVEPTYHLAGMDGTVDGVLSASPMTTLTADTDSVVVTATYNKDTNAVINTLAERLAALEATTSI